MTLQVLADLREHKLWQDVIDDVIGGVPIGYAKIVWSKTLLESHMILHGRITS